MVVIQKPSTDRTHVEYKIKDLIGYNVKPTNQVFLGEMGPNGGADSYDYYMCTYNAVVLLRDPIQTWSEDSSALAYVYEWVDIAITIQRRDA